MRLDRVWAITWRDLRIELGGRRGFALPGIAGLLLLPLAGAPDARDGVRDLIEWRVSGDVPAEVAAHEEVRVVDAPGPDVVHFAAPTPAEPQWVLTGPRIPNPIRQAMDARDTRVTVTPIARRRFEMPNRSLFLSLIAASILTGALSQSIPGERSQRTLETLLTAAVTPLEIVTGKWLAWGGFGAVVGLVACLLAVLLGHQPAGMWLLAVPWVALGTVAMGLYLVRRAADVVGGATIALRMLPALLSFLGLAAWGAGTMSPWLGASVPIGGALLAAGALWDEPGPILWAVVVTAGTCAALLVATGRDLDAAQRRGREAGLVGALLVAALAALAWWVTVPGAELWTWGGAPERTAAIPPHAGVAGGAACLAALVLVRLARDPRPLAGLGLCLPTWSAWPATALAAVGLALVPSLAGVAAAPADPGWAPIAARFAAALTPVTAPPSLLVLVVAGQELLFRGWIREQGGEAVAAVAFALVFTPTDPFVGLALGAVLGRLATLAGGSVLPGLALRVGLTLTPTTWVPPWTAGLGVIALVGAMAWWGRTRRAAPAVVS